MNKERHRVQRSPLSWLVIGGIGLVWACAMPGQRTIIKGSSGTVDAGAIVSSKTGRPVSFEQMMADLASVQVVYVGEQHARKEHHAVQLQVIEAFYRQHPAMVVGMEMFDRSYQPVLDDWSRGRLAYEDLLRHTHWYANWRFDDGLYRPILEWIKANRIPLVALNLPFHIPPKIRVGGIDHLAEWERNFLPAAIDTGNAPHREYVESVFNQHRFGGRTQFEDFYLAQCVWEETMAEAVAEGLSRGPMVVLAGNGHIQYKYGIPERAHLRGGAEYRTIYLATPGEEVALSIGDYIWITE